MTRNQASARLGQVLKNQGGATGKAAKAAEDYADSLSRKIGVDHVTIENAQTILASFHSVGDAAGRNSVIFNGATKSAADLAAAGFGSITTNSKTLGKSLDDPTKGMTQLRRVGVTLTQTQQNQIKFFDGVGQHGKAQALLLKDVQDKVGGTAAKTATSTQKMQVAYQDLQESIGQALLPILGSLQKILQPIMGFIAAHSKILAPLILGFAGLAVAIWAVNFALDANVFTLIALAIAAVAAGVVVLWLRFSVFRDIVKDVWKVVSTVVKVSIDIVVAEINSDCGGRGDRAGIRGDGDGGRSGCR